MTAHYFDALDPERSAIVEACAGSGKTWMLVSRILRLLLAGVPPGDILAITFTRLAAREMESRLMTWLKALALDSDEQVVTFLMDRGLSPVEARALLPRARGLYEAYLQASPTVTLCTFDVWFLRLLRHAPLAGPLRRDSVPGTDTRKLRQEVWQSLLRQAEGARQRARGQTAVQRSVARGVAGDERAGGMPQRSVCPLPMDVATEPWEQAPLAPGVAKVRGKCCVAVLALRSVTFAHPDRPAQRAATRAGAPHPPWRDAAQWWTSRGDA